MSTEEVASRLASLGGVPVDVYGAGCAALGHIGDNEWELRERVFVVALMLGDEEVAEAQRKALKARFSVPSKRLAMLRALKNESEGLYSEALKVYEAILKRDEVYMAALRRRSCVYKAQGKLKEAAEALTDFLKLYPSDQAGWLEQADLYIRMGNYDLAAYCYEEVILLAPYHYLYHIRYAEILYTMGGKHFETARAHYLQSLDLKPSNNNGALLGLAMCLKAKFSKTKASDVKLLEWVKKQIEEVYADSEKRGVAMQALFDNGDGGD